MGKITLPEEDISTLSCVWVYKNFDPFTADQLTQALEWWWPIRFHQTPRIQQLLTHNPPSVLRHLSDYGQARLALWQWDVEGAKRQLKQIIDCDTVLPEELAKAYYQLGQILSNEQELPHASTDSRQSSPDLVGDACLKQWHKALEVIENCRYQPPSFQQLYPEICQAMIDHQKR